jgi:uncharacterized membrane protein
MATTMTTMAFAQQEQPASKHDWLLKRNCSLTPRQLALAYAVQCVLSFAVAMMFTLQGAWYVLIFSMLEMSALALAFLYYARHATDHEHIALVDGCLLVERIVAGEVQQIRLDPYWTRIAVPKQTESLINLEAKGVKIEVGRFVTAAKRRQVAQELRQELRRSSFMISQT